jgi:hypothetical protein
MTYHAADSRSGPVLYVAAATTLIAIGCSLLYLVSLLLTRLNLEIVRALGVLALDGLLVAAPVAVATSLILRCRACDRLLLPLVYDGKSLFSAKSPSAFAIVRVAIAIVTRRRAPCPHCGVEAQV